MIVLPAIVILALVVIALAAGRRGSASTAPAAPSESLLVRAVAAGIISEEQAGAIDALGQLPPPEGAGVAAAAPPRVPIMAEILGYVGAVLAIVGVVVLVSQFWDDMASWSRLTVLGIVAACLAGAGAAVDEDADAALWRLRGFLWLLSSAALAFATGLLAADVLEWGPEAVALTVGVVTAFVGMAMWQLRDRPAQQTVVLAGLIAATVGSLAWLSRAGAIGLGLVALGAAWAWLGWLKRLPPPLVALVMGPALVLVGAGVTSGSWPGVAPILGLACAGGILALGVAGREFIFTGIGVIGTLIYLPWTAGHFFADTIGVPVVLLMTGALLLGLALFLLRRRGPAPKGAARPPLVS